MITKDASNKAPRSRSAKAGNDASPTRRTPSHALHQTLGNQGVQRLLRAGVIQAKLRVYQPNDSYEQEADRVSEQVMHMPGPQLRLSCACSGECPKCRAQQPGQEHVRSQTKRVQSSDLGQTAAPPVVCEVLRSPGQRLDPAARAFPINTYLTLSLDSSLSVAGGPGESSTFLAKVAVRIDPGKQGGLFALGSVGAGRAVGSNVSGASSAELGANFRATDFLDVHLVRETVSGGGDGGATTG